RDGSAPTRFPLASVILRGEPVTADHPARPTTYRSLPLMRLAKAYGSQPSDARVVTEAPVTADPPAPMAAAAPLTLAPAPAASETAWGDVPPPPPRRPRPAPRPSPPPPDPIPAVTEQPRILSQDLLVDSESPNPDGGPALGFSRKSGYMRLRAELRLARV